MPDRQVARASSEGAVTQAGRDMFVMMGDDAIVKALTKIFADNPDMLDAPTARVVQERAEEIVSRVVEEISVSDDLKGNLAEPSVRRAINDGVREYATYESNSLSRETYVKLLLAKVQHPGKDFTSIVSSQALALVPRLTDSHLQALAALFLFRGQLHLASQEWSVKEVDAYYRAVLTPVFVALKAENRLVRYLDSTGCIHFDTTQLWNLPTQMNGLFPNVAREVPEGSDIVQYLCRNGPFMNQLFRRLNEPIPPDGSLKSCMLTPEGTAIGHAFATGKLGYRLLPLEIYLQNV